MDKILVVVFDSEDKAHAGLTALKDLHAEGILTLYDAAVVAKDASGKAAVQERTNESGPVGTVVGLLAGGALGVIGGPLGVAFGATIGATGGAAYDLATVGVGADFLDHVAGRLEPGKAAVVAEVQEEEIVPVDTRLQAIGGTVYRRRWGDLVDAEIERDTAALDAELDAMEAEYDRADQQARARLQSRIDAAKAELRATHERAKARAEATQREAEAKIIALKAQAATARAEQKQRIDQRLAEVQADRQARTAKLDRAGQLIHEALHPGRSDGETLTSELAAATDGHSAIERVREGMVVVGADGKAIGKVALIRMGDPEAVSTRGQERTITFAALALKEEPDVPEALRPGLVRVGYLKVERGGVLGIGEKERYVRSDQIARVSTDQVTLSVTEAQLPDEQPD